MNKKTYKQPSVKVVELDSNNIMTITVQSPGALPVNEDGVGENPYPGDEKYKDWGSQW